jgi:hypothetical protein
MGKLIYLWERLQEPGSQRAIMFLCGIFNIPGVEVSNWQGVLTMIVGIIAIWTPEALPETKVKGFSK